MDRPKRPAPTLRPRSDVALLPFETATRPILTAITASVFKPRHSLVHTILTFCLSAICCSICNATKGLEASPLQSSLDTVVGAHDSDSCHVGDGQTYHCMRPGFVYDYKFAPRHLQFMREQIWEAANDISVYSQTSEHEFRQIEDYIPKGIRSVLELGSGLGRGSIFLNQLLQDDSVLYTLADRSGYTSNTGAFNPKQDEFYNDLILTQDFCELNGIKNVRTFDTESGDWSTLPKADFIFSVCSFGMHVSIERYMERILSVAKANCTLIFGVRDKSYGPNSFKDLFEHVIYVPEWRLSSITTWFPPEDWLILKNPIRSQHSSLDD